MKIKLMPRADLVKPGDIFIFDNVRIAELRYDVLPYLEEGEPHRIIVCAPEQVEELRKMIEESSHMELVE
jgi:hypothetical protein